MQNEPVEPCPTCPEGWRLVGKAHCAACYEGRIADWIAYADRLERVLELVCGESKDRLVQTHAEQGLRLVRPDGQSSQVRK